MKKLLVALIATGLLLLAASAMADDSASSLSDSSSAATADSQDPSQWERVAERELVVSVENPDQIPLRAKLGMMYLRVQNPDNQESLHFYEFEIFGKSLIRYWPKIAGDPAFYQMLVNGKWQMSKSGATPTAHLVTKCRLFRRSPMIGIQLKLEGEDGKMMELMVRPEPKK